MARKRVITVTVKVYESSVEMFISDDNDVVRFMTRDFTQAQEPNDRDISSLITGITEEVNDWRNEYR